MAVGLKPGSTHFEEEEIDPFCPVDHSIIINLHTDIVAWAVESLSNRRRRPRRSSNFLSPALADLSSPASGSLSNMPDDFYSADSNANQSPFGLLLADSQAFSVWERFVSLPEDQQSSHLRQQDNLESGSLSSSYRTAALISPSLRPGRNISLRPPETMTPLSLLDTTESLDSPRGRSRRLRRRQQRQEDLFHLDLGEPAITVERHSSLTEQLSALSLTASSVSTSESASLRSISFETQTQLCARIVTQMATISHRQRRNRRLGSSNDLPKRSSDDSLSSSVANSFSYSNNTASSKPVWQQNLPKASLKVSCWEYLNHLEEKLRSILEGNEELKISDEIRLQDGSLLLDKKQNRIGLRLHNRIPLSQYLGGYLHSLANFYRLSFDSEWTGKGKKRMAEGWIYLPPSDSKKARKKPDFRRKSVPEGLFCDIAATFADSLL